MLELLQSWVMGSAVTWGSADCSGDSGTVLPYRAAARCAVDLSRLRQSATAAVLSGGCAAVCGGRRDPKP